MQFDSIFDDNRFGYWWYRWWVVKEGEENDGLKNKRGRR